jgi:hypothetical protein
MKMLYILDCFSDPNIEIIFRFLCSSECNNGINFIDTKTTNYVYKFINLVTSKRSVLIEVGECVFYESALCLHGRQTPFNGNYYANMYCHFTLE